MIIKSFNLNDIKHSKSNFFLFYGKNEGQKEEIIYDLFLKDYDGDVVKYDENQILENKEVFFDTCLNESLFEKKKIIQVSRVTTKLYEIIKEILEKNIVDKKIILNSELLDKKSKIRKLFETEKNLVCIPFYEDNISSLYKIANDFFKKNKISISSENINIIVDKCSGDRKNLKNEINKILNFSFTQKKISKEQIFKLINMHENENFFGLIDFCLAKKHNKVTKIINNNTFSKNDSIILIRSFLSRLKRLLELKKLLLKVKNIEDTIKLFKPTIFWKDKEIVNIQMKIWSTENIYVLIEKLNILEINFKKNNELSNNIIFDLILNTSKNFNN